MVNLVEDDKGAGRFGDLAVQRRTDRDLRVGDGDAVIAAPAEGFTVAVPRIQPDADAVCRFRPLALEVFGRGDDRHAVDDTAGDEFGGESQRERGLACTRRRGC